jgi:hypothetical protein
VPKVPGQPPNWHSGTNTLDTELSIHPEEIPTCLGSILSAQATKNLSLTLVKEPCGESQSLNSPNALITHVTRGLAKYGKEVPKTTDRRLIRAKRNDPNEGKQCGEP